MIVNKYAGRSHLDPANYPVFPWILTNFKDSTLEYRNLSKTIGALVFIVTFREVNKEVNISGVRPKQQILSIQSLPINMELIIVPLE